MENLHAAVAFYVEKVFQEILVKLFRQNKMLPGSIWRTKDFYDRMKQGKCG